MFELRHTYREFEMFQITLNEKLVKIVLAEYLADQLDEYTDKDLKAAGVPTRKKLVEQVMAEPKFQKALVKKLAEVVNDGDRIHDALDDMPMSAVKDALTKLGAVA
jgi:chemotaxis protein CheY-P-specific phosphatase CheC